MKKNLFFGLLLSLISTLSYGQKNSISGQVLDPDRQGLAFGNVVLYAAADSQMVKLQLSDDEGQYRFPHIPPGDYWIAVSYVGLPDQQTDLFSLAANENKSIPTLIMQAPANDLEEVTVVAKRPLLELKPDKMVFNVEGSVNATGNNALDLLRKAPGVIVDNNESITMLGRSGVQVYIDGKKSPLSADDLAAYLKTLQSTDIDNIEIISNPPAKYEAEGSAGIINIRLKKDQSLGANANLSAGYSIGQKAQYTASINSNYRNKKANVFGTYSYNRGETVEFLDLYREQFGLAFDQKSNSNGQWAGHNYKIGADYFLNKKHTLGFIVNGSTSENSWMHESNAFISMIGREQVDSILTAGSDGENSQNNRNYNLNYRFDNGEGSVWNIDADYGQFRNDSDREQPNSYYESDGETLKRRANFATIAPTDIDIYTFKIDHENTLWKGQLGAGAKFSYIRTDNTFDFFNMEDGQRFLDLERSNQFIYTEMVNAAYLSYSRQLKKWGMQAGVRVEHTNSEGDLTTNDPLKDRNTPQSYTDLFPSAGLTYQLNPKHTFQLTYSRRINRPNYQDLNPFEGKLDELTFEKGNPFLTPEYANNLKLTHSFNYFLHTSLSYSQTKDVITRITEAYQTNGTYIEWRNLAKQQDYSLNIGASIPITKWWNSYTDLTGYIRSNKADYGTGKVIDISTPTFNMYSQHTFQLPKDFSLELSGWYTTASLWGGNFTMEEMYSIDAGIQKKLFDGKGTLKVSINDIFKSNKWRGVSRFGELYMDISGGNDTRRLAVNFSYLFGNNKVKSRRRNAGLEEESKRIKSDK